MINGNILLVDERLASILFDIVVNLDAGCGHSFHLYIACETCALL